MIKTLRVKLLVTQRERESGEDFPFDTFIINKELKTSGIKSVQFSIAGPHCVIDWI